MHDGVVGRKIGHRVVYLVAQHVDYRVYIFANAFVAGFFGHCLLYVGHVVGTNFAYTFFNLLSGLVGR